MTEQQIKTRITELAQMNDAQWESLCKQCGVCCMLKHSRINGAFYAGVACNHLDLKTRLCDIYSTRLCHHVFCSRVDLSVVLRTGLLPDSCGYIEYIYGPATNQIKPDFNKIIHERDMNATADTIHKKTARGPWNFIIPESLYWRTRAMELRDKYADFGRDIVRRMEKQH